MSEQIQETASLKRVFNPAQKSYFNRLKEEMRQIAMVKLVLFFPAGAER